MLKSLHPWGLTAATIMFTLGLTPSLLPRDWFYQGLVSGVAAGAGYGIGIVAHVLRSWFGGGPHLSRRARRVLDVVLGAAALAWLTGMVIRARGWQAELAELTGAPLPSLSGSLLVLPVGLFFFLLVLGLARGLRALAGWVHRVLPERFAPSARGVAAWLAVLLISVWAVEWAIPGAIIAAAERTLTATNSTPEDPAPTLVQRSGSPASLIAHEDTGRYGGRFLDQGLTGAELSEALGRPAEEPIRLYAGLTAADTDRARAGLIIEELERTDAAEREAILLVMTTGTGWVNHHVAQAFEMLYAGDSAIVGEQYSALPSAFHFLGGGQAVADAGRDFLGPIVDWWNRLPADDRPALYLYGESLGTTGAENAFSGTRDIVNSVDGVMLAGPPFFNPLWPEIVARRDPGTTQVLPEYEDGEVVRFADGPELIRRWYGEGSDARWGPGRVLYVQHASDPVVWWSPRLALQEPDWLREPAGADRLPEMTWLPVITFLQVAADLPVSQNAPQGHGHNYGDSMLDGLAAIAGQGRFEPAEVDRLREPFRAAVLADAR